MSTETVSSVSSRTLTLLAGRLLIGLALLHIVFFLVAAWDHLPGWLAGDLWTTEMMTESIGYFWALPGSFAVPMLLLGGIVVRAAREDRPVPAYVTWGLTTWAVACSLLMEPAGFPLALVPAGLLVAAAVRDQKRGGRLARKAATPSA